LTYSNGSQFQTATQTLTASSTLNLNGSNQNIIFDIPAGQGKSVFIDPRFSTLNFRVNYEIVNTPSAAVITNMQLRSSAMAHFELINVTLLYLLSTHYHIQFSPFIYIYF